MKENTTGHLVKVVRAKTGTKRVLAVSDIHGSLNLFQELLGKMDYRSGEDTLVIVGDLLEKGEDSLGTLQFVMELAKHENVYVLCGNCDYSQGDAPEDAWNHLNFWREKATHWQMGLRAGIAMPTGTGDVLEYRAKLVELYPEEHAFLKNLPHILETEHFLFAHAGLKDEDLENQELSYILTARAFPEQTEHVFSKLLVVGHYPTANYRKDEIDNSPYYDAAHNILSIDGGNVVKTRLSQLNGIILENETGGWSWEATDFYEKIAAPCGQEEKAGGTILWPDKAVELLKRGEEFSQVRHHKSGTLMEIPTEYLYETPEGLSSEDISTSLFAVEKDEPLRLIKRYSDRLMVSKQGKCGFLSLK